MLGKKDNKTDIEIEGNVDVTKLGKYDIKIVASKKKKHISRKVAGHDTTRLFSLTDLMINIITSTIRTVTEPAIKYLTHLLFIKHTNFLI